MWLFWYCVEIFQFVGMVMVAILIPGLIAPPVGSYFGKLWHVDDQIIIGAAFFIILVAEVWAYDRFQQWRYFRKLKP